MGFPEIRLRRLRRTDLLRRMVRETVVRTGDLIQPLFVRAGTGERRPIEGMPGQAQLSSDVVVDEASELLGLGIPAVILFGIPSRKDELGSEAYDPDGTVQTTLRRLKDAAPDLVVVTDVCLCQYTEHGHCGVLADGEVGNDETVELLAQTAVTHAEAGADLVAPSDMMDGRVQAIRRALDQAGYEEVGILSYAAKFFSSFYGPFREAAESAPKFGDRRSYQMDPANAREALREVALDVEEGADLVMVKPALPCLDIIRQVRDRFDLPVCAYQVSGEYAMIKAAAQRGWVDEEGAVVETLTAVKRAGADLIVTYFAKDLAERLREGA